MMRSHIAMALVLLGGALVATAQDAKDVAFVSKEGGYSVRFPLWADVKTHAKESPDGVKGTLTIAAGDGKDLRVIFSMMPEPFPAEDIFTGAIARAKKADVKLVRVEQITLGAEKYPGRDITVEQGGNSHRSRVFVVGTKVYVTSVNGPKGYAAGKEAEDFFRSFELVPAGKGKK